MKTKFLSVGSLLLTFYVCEYLYAEWFNPSGSLILLISTFIVSILNSLSSIIIVRKERNVFTIIAAITSIISAVIMCGFFFIMFAMGV